MPRDVIHQIKCYDYIKMSSRGSFCSNSPGIRHQDPSSIFDPFLLRENHQEHYESTSIIKLNSSNRVFCPICLQNTPANEICRVSKDAYDQYVRNFFEALDQHSETKRFRAMFIPLIDIVLSKRPYQPTGDYEFHKILRILRKLAKSDLFTAKEFCLVSRIFESITANFTAPKTTPLSAIWSGAKYLMDRGKVHLSRLEDNKESHECVLEVRAGIATMIKTYLGFLEYFAIDSVFEIIPPLHQNDLPENICRKYYRQSQIDCFSYALEDVVTEFITGYKPIVSNMDARSIVKIYSCLDKCITAADRIDYHDVPQHLVALDLMKISYDTIRDCQRDVKKQTIDPSIRSFLRTYVIYFMRQYIGTDKEVDRITKSSAEINGRNISKFIKRKEHPERIKFYILANYVALRQRSSFFVQHRVERLIQTMDPMILIGSPVILRTYLLVVARVITNLREHNSLQDHINQVCQRLDRESIKSIFCSDESIFYLVCKCQWFKNIVESEDIKFFLEKSIDPETVKTNLYYVIKDKFYKSLVMKYIMETENSSQIIVRALKVEEESSKESIPQDFINSEMSSSLTALLHGLILDCLNNDRDESSRLRLAHLCNVTTSILSESPEFNFTFDNQFKDDLFELMEILYIQILTDKVQDSEELILLNEFLTQLIRSRNEYMLTILKKLDFKVLGLMYQCISDYSRGDLLAESVARLLVAYDEIPDEIPIQFDVAASLVPLAESMFNWMLSPNEDLHHVSLISAPHILRHRNVDKSKKISISVGLMHMMFRNPSLLENSRYCKTIVSLFEFEEVAYNPLLTRVIPLLPQAMRELIYADNDNCEDDAMSDLSFESCISIEDEEYESLRLDQMIEEAIDIIDRTDQLDANGLPSSIYASRGVDDAIPCQNRPLMAEVEAYERMALETTRDRSPELIIID